jgi:endonuclease G, mitochondrial
MHKSKPNRSIPVYRQLTSFTILLFLVLQNLLLISPFQVYAAPSTNIVISQFQVAGDGGSAAADEFVELHNVGSTNFDLNGHRIVYRSATGTTDVAMVNWTTSIIIPPGGYYLIAHSTGYNGTTSPNATFNTGSTGTLSGASGGIAIRNGATNTGTIIDSVGYGTATNAFVETATISVPPSNDSRARKLSGCTDTDNNSADFAPQSPSDPRNSASPVFTCGVTPTPTPTATPTPTNPTAIGAANPNTVEAGAATLLTVNVTPGTNPSSTGLAVTADLSSIGGSATQTFLDNGSNGDAAAGDNTFSYQATVAPATTAGNKTLAVSVTDAQARTAPPTSIALTVNAPAPPAPTTLVISQIYGGGGNSGATYKNDFVEIFNNGTQTVTFSNWSVQYASSAGTSWQRTPISGTLQPGQYYLVQLAAGSGGTENLPTPDTIGTINMSGTSGKVALVKNNTSLSGSCPTGDPNVLDFVGYGGANCFEGSSPAPTLSNTTAATRSRGGCRDTNFNGANFVEAAPAPRNSASALNACPAGDPSPEVYQTTPSGGATSASLTGNIAIDFDEAVDVVGNWYQISCTKSGLHPATANAATGTSFTLDPQTDFASNETCIVTVFAAQVTDVDTIDPPDNMAADFVWSFTTLTVRDPLVHLTMGNPSGATADTTNENNYLMAKPEYSLSYNRSRGTPNWTSWHLDSSWLGSAPRQNDFRPDSTLPAGWYQVMPTDYSGSGFDRGHMLPSADRTATVQENSATFLMTNMIPQAPDNNQGPWADLEIETRNFLNGSQNEAYVISGSVGTGGVGSNGARTSLAGGQVTVPAQTWKVIMILPNGDDDVSRVTTGTRTIAVIMPNAQGIRNDDWKKYLVTVDDVEALTGYDFFSNVPVSVQAVIESGLDGNSNAAPVAESQTVSTSEDQGVAVTLSATDSNVNNTLTYTIVNAPAHGMLSGEGANLVYTPNADYNGADSFTFKASDGTLNSNTATVSINVASVNDAPELSPIGNKSVVPGDTLNFTATASDVDFPADTLTFSLAGTIPAGASINPLSGEFSWKPEDSQYGQHSLTVQATDAGGLYSQQTFTVSVEDNVAPTVTINSPTEGANYALNQTVLAGYNCADSGSGIQSCTGTTANGATVDTSSVGTKTFTVTAVDRAGNQSTQIVTYNVGYSVVALFDQTKPNNTGSNIPIKLRIVDANGVNLSSANIQIVAVRVDPGNLPAQSPGNSNPANVFSFDATSQSYQYNLKTEKAWAAGTYQLIFRVAGDPVERSVGFNVR